MNDSASTLNPFMSYSGQPSSAKFTPVVPVAAATTLNASQSGSIVSITASSAYTVSLPAPQAGLNYDLVIGTAGANIVSVTATGTIVHGECFDCWGAGAIIPACLRINAKTTVSFNTSAPVGSRLNLICDGTNWYCFGVSPTAAASTGWTTAP